MESLKARSWTGSSSSVTVMDGQQLVRDYIEHLNEVEDASTIAFLKAAETGKAVDFVAEMWGLDYEVVEF